MFFLLHRVGLQPKNIQQFSSDRRPCKQSLLSIFVSPTKTEIQAKIGILQGSLQQNQSHSYFVEETDVTTRIMHLKNSDHISVGKKPISKTGKYTRDDILGQLQALPCGM
jgi:hypothetical protein